MLLSSDASWKELEEDSLGDKGVCAPAEKTARKTADPRIGTRRISDIQPEDDMSEPRRWIFFHPGVVPCPRALN